MWQGNSFFFLTKVDALKLIIPASLPPMPIKLTIILVPHNVYGVKNDQFCCFVSNLCVDYGNENIDLVEGEIGFHFFNGLTLC